MSMSHSCGICGRLVPTDAGSAHPARRAQLAERDMQAHLDTHSFAEVLRFEIRRNLDEVPDEQRPTIIRDIYRSLLGTMTPAGFRLNAEDAMGVYPVDEALGCLDLYRFWRDASACGRVGCTHP